MHVGSDVRELRNKCDLPVSDSRVYDSSNSEDALRKLKARLLVDLAELTVQVGGISTAALRVTGLEVQSPMYVAGIREGDVITLAEGRPVKSKSQIKQLLQDHIPGDVIEFTVHTPAPAAEAESSESAASWELQPSAAVGRCVELWSDKKKYTVEMVRALRRLAGLPVLGEATQPEDGQQDSEQESATDNDTEEDE